MATAATTAPTTELGTAQTQTGWASPILDERETARDLRFPRSAKTFAQMMNDAQVEGLYKGATLPIRAYKWWLDPNGAPPALVDRISTDYGLPIGADGHMNQRRTQGRFRFDGHLEDALRAIAYGFYPFEQVFDYTDPSKGGDGLYHIRKLAPRPPRIVAQVKPARDGGLEYIRVPALNAQPAGGLGLQQGMRGGVELPVSHLLMYVWDQEGANWVGRSMLRSSYGPWKLKARVMQVGAINIERAGGVPYINAPDGATGPQMQQLHQLAASFRVGQNAGAALPFGAELKFASAAGGDQAVNYVRLQNEEMARAWLMMFMQSGQSSTGHGSTQQIAAQIDYFAEVQKAIAGWFCDVFNEHQIEDDVEWNEGPDQQYAPLLRFTATGDALDALATNIDDAQAAGALPADSQVAAIVRDEVRPGSRARAMRLQARVAAATAQTPAERSQTDFTGLQASFRTALTAMQSAWADVQATQIDHLVAQVATAATVAELAAIAAPAATGAVLLSILVDLVTHGAQTVVDSATAQGATMTMPSLNSAHTQISQAADATATLLARSLADSAASRAVALHGPDTDPATIAAGVRDHLEALTGAATDYELEGLASRAQNEGRFTALEHADGAKFYASAVNDVNRCEPCAEENDQEFDTVAEARQDFPTGGYVGCEGRNRCRCTVVAVFDETLGQA